VERDEDLRTACFSRLAILQAQYGGELPYASALAPGFLFRGRHVPFLNRQKGIHRAAVQRGPAALSIQTSFASPYGDAFTDAGLRYAYRAGSINQPDNKALQEAFALRVPLVYFFSTRPGAYQPFYPCYVLDNNRASREVVVSMGKWVGPLDEQEPLPPDDLVERRYVNREVRSRMHQGRFRGLVLPAYHDQCAICRLKELRLLDAAHIVGDLEQEGTPVVSNGLSLCTIHHRAFDHDLVGISPDYRVHLSRRLLDDEDGAMLDLLKRFHGASLEVPDRTRLRPDRERLAVRFERFSAAA
jgi:putative restriction endonuclease